MIGYVCSSAKADTYLGRKRCPTTVKKQTFNV